MGDPWWKSGVVYQVYPRSFQDSNGDGVGDLAGIESRLDHLVRLGVDAVWLSPVFPSPMADFGYDVSDYCGVDPLFGNLADLDRLIASLHERGLKIVLDFVPNHTSEEHAWFRASRSSRDDPKRDWYLWRDPAPDGGPPNNWLSHFAGSSWEFDAATGQYYLHSFLKEQPDLNWRNPAVRQAMYDVLRFWLGRGVDGFRVDVMWLMIKDDQYRDNPPNPRWRAGRPGRQRLLPLYDADRPEVHEIVAEMRAVLDAYGDRVLIGEIYLPFERLAAYYGRGLRGAQMPFNFALVSVKWEAEAVATLVRDYEAALPSGAWPNYVLGNHDVPRIASRIGTRRARLAMLLLLTLRGTPTIYYGDELGMQDAEIAPDRVRDPAELRQPGVGLGRDPERAPMPWDASAARGFTTGEPWLPIESRTADVAAQDADGGSMLAFVRQTLALRRGRPELTAGSLEDVAVHGTILSYRRVLGTTASTVLLNFGEQSATAPGVAGCVLLVTGERDPCAFDVTVELRPGEGVVIGTD